MATIPAPFNKRIRITSHPHPKGHSTTSIVDADTGEPLPVGILSIHINIATDNVVMADIAYGNITFPSILRCPVTAIDVTISPEMSPLWRANSGKD
jgi:hypothetical protein